MISVVSVGREFKRLMYRDRLAEVRSSRKALLSRDAGPLRGREKKAAGEFSVGKNRDAPHLLYARIMTLYFR